MRIMLAMVAVLLSLSIGPVEAAEEPHLVPNGQTVAARVVGVHDSDTITTLTDRRDAILPKLLSGDIRLSEAEEALAPILTLGDCACVESRLLMDMLFIRCEWR